VSTTGEIVTLANSADSFHTPAMNLKTASFLALIGTLLLTILLAVNFIRDVLGVAEGIIPAMSLLAPLVYLIAALCATLFFYVFHRGQS
jgi:hypothetical protein